MTINDLILLFGAGGIGTLATAFISAWLKRGEHTLSEAAAIRKESADIRQELRAENASILQRLDNVENEVDAWRTKYFTLQSDYNKLRVDYDVLKLDYGMLKSEKESLSQKYNEMQAEIDALRKEISVLRARKK